MLVWTEHEPAANPGGLGSNGSPQRFSETIYIEVALNSPGDDGIYRLVKLRGSAGVRPCFAGTYNVAIPLRQTVCCSRRHCWEFAGRFSDPTMAMDTEDSNYLSSNWNAIQLVGPQRPCANSGVMDQVGILQRLTTYPVSPCAT